MTPNNILQMFEGYREYSLQSYPKILIKIKHELDKVKINKIKIQPNFNSESLEKELTIYTKPRGDTFINHSCGYLNYLNGRSTIEQLIYSGLKEKIFLKIDGKDIEIGCFLKEVNIIMIYSNLFYSNLSVGLKNDFIFLQLKAITDFIKKNKIKKVDTKKYEQERIIREFSENAEKQIQELNNKMSEREKQTKEYNKYLIDFIKLNIIDKEVLKTLIKLKGNVIELVKKQIEEIKKLPFVKSVTLLNKGIRVSIDNIKINNVFIGDFYIYIKPNKITMENRKALRYDKHDDAILHHPHINTPSDICYGSRNDKVNELLGKGEYKKLIYFLVLFLRSYNSEDKHHSIKHWKTAKKGISGFSGDEDDDDDDEEY